MPLWDRLFAPLLAAAAGALTTDLFVHPNFSLPIPVYPQMHFVDILSGYRDAYRYCRRNGGRLVLAAVACVDEPSEKSGADAGSRRPAAGDSWRCRRTYITLFKGLEEMQQIALSQTLTAGDFLLIALVKLAALVIASASGFRGGRIFPAVFVGGVALGFMLHAHVEAVPAAITVSCAILGMTLVVTRDGWLSLFMAAVVAGYDAATAAVS